MAGFLSEGHWSGIDSGISQSCSNKSMQILNIFDFIYCCVLSMSMILYNAVF